MVTLQDDGLHAGVPGRYCDVDIVCQPGEQVREGMAVEIDRVLHVDERASVGPKRHRNPPFWRQFTLTLFRLSVLNEGFHPTCRRICAWGFGHFAGCKGRYAPVAILPSLPSANTTPIAAVTR